MAEISGYYDSEEIARAVAEGRHREVIGGLWEAVGSLQFEFLRANGLSPESRLLDIGCGSLRGGLRFVEFLAPGNYFGIDINEPLLNAGYEIELKQRGLDEKLPRGNLICDAEFQFDRLPVSFDFAIAQSLFTHLPANHIQLCLARLRPKMAPGGKFFATFFLVPDDHPIGRPFDHPEGVQSFDAKDPYHYRPRQLRALCAGLDWTPVIIGQWGHPRGQQMVAFYPAPVTAGQEQGDFAARQLDLVEAEGLPPGAFHYRAFVGPPDRYDFLSASQFALLFALGLRDRHKVLDFGCGSLRLGRLLIPYLQKSRYFAIEPNKWLIDDALDRELGRDILDIKQPSFAFNADFRCDVFGEKFDFIVAQSILTHCGIDLADRLLSSMRDALQQDGRIIFSMTEAASPLEKPAETGWVYPQCVSYGRVEIPIMCRRAGLCCARIPWHHPGATWYLAAHAPEQLPSLSDLWLLKGAVLFDPQFAASRVLAQP